MKRIGLGFLFLFSTALLNCAKKEEAKLKVDAGNRLYHQKQLGPALSMYKQAIELDPGNEVALMMAGKTLFYSREYDEARHFFQKALDTNQHKISAMIWIAKIDILSKNDYQKAADLLEQALAYDDSNIEALFFKAVIHERRNEIPQAIEAYRIAAEECKKAIPVFSRIAEFFDKAGIQSEAERYRRMAAVLAQ